MDVTCGPVSVDRSLVRCEHTADSMPTDTGQPMDKSKDDEEQEGADEAVSLNETTAETDGDNVHTEGGDSDRSAADELSPPPSKRRKTMTADRVSSTVRPTSKPHHMPAKPLTNRVRAAAAVMNASGGGSALHLAASMPLVKSGISVSKETASRVVRAAARAKADAVLEKKASGVLPSKGPNKSAKSAPPAPSSHSDSHRLSTQRTRRATLEPQVSKATREPKVSKTTPEPQPALQIGSKHASVLDRLKHRNANLRATPTPKTKRLSQTDTGLSVRAHAHTGRPTALSAGAKRGQQPRPSLSLEPRPTQESRPFRPLAGNRTRPATKGTTNAMTFNQPTKTLGPTVTVGAKRKLATLNNHVNRATDVKRATDIKHVFDKNDDDECDDDAGEDGDGAGDGADDNGAAEADGDDDDDANDDADRDGDGKVDTEGDDEVDADDNAEDNEDGDDDGASDRAGASDRDGDTDRDNSG